jgi:hypothetical protein
MGVRKRRRRIHGSAGYGHKLRMVCLKNHRRHLPGY